MFIGIGVFFASTIAAGGIEAGSSGFGTYFAGMAIIEGYAASSMFFSYGVARLAGANNQKFKDDIAGTFIPSTVDIATSMNDSRKRSKKDE